MKLYRAEYKYLKNDEVIKGYMDFVGEDFYSVLAVITNEVNELVEDCELLGIFEILINGASVNIVNYADPDCECAYCRADRVPLDMIACFACPNCEEDIVVAENGWEHISCNACSADIYRHFLSRSKNDGKWYYTKEQAKEED